MSGLSLGVNWAPQVGNGTWASLDLSSVMVTPYTQGRGQCTFLLSSWEDCGPEGRDQIQRVSKMLVRPDEAFRQGLLAVFSNRGDGRAEFDVKTEKHLSDAPRGGPRRTMSSETVRGDYDGSLHIRVSLEGDDGVTKAVMPAMIADLIAEAVMDGRTFAGDFPY